MSKNHNEMIKCPKCGKEDDFKVWESINTADTPEMKELVRNGEAFMWHCPECGNDSVVFYPTYYHQPEDNVLIHYVPEAPDEAVSFMKQLDHDPYDEAIPLGFGCRKRVVGDMNHFREKLIILDEGLDDRIIELMKIFIIAEIQTQNPDQKITDIFFNKEKDGKSTFAVHFDNDKWGGTDFNQNNYDQVAKAFQIPLAADDEVVIDTNWAFSKINDQI